jgi:hypothetical protein
MNIIKFTCLSKQFYVFFKNKERKKSGQNDKIFLESYAIANPMPVGVYDTLLSLSR